MIDLKLINTFIEVARLKSLNLASKKLFLTQSALSQRIQALETEVGSSLFLRNYTGMEMTAVGREFYSLCLELNQDMSKMDAWVKDKNKDQSGSINISSISGFAIYISPNFLKKFLQKYPDIRFTIEIDVSDGIENAVLEGRADLGIIVGECKKDSLKALKLSNNHLCMICSSQFSLANKGKITRDDLKDVRFIWHSNSNSRTVKQIHKNLDFTFQERKGDIFVADMNACKAFALEGLGIAFVSKMFIMNELKEGTLVTLPGFSLNRPMYLISRNIKHELPAISIFKKELAAHCAQLEY